MPKPIEAWLSHPWVDWIVGVGSSVLLVMSDIGIAVPLVSDLSHDQRLALYQSLAGVAGALLGFFIATISILMTLMNSETPRLAKALSGGNSTEIQSYFFAGILATAFALVLFLLLVALDNREEINSCAEVGLISAVLVAGLSTSRIIWVLRKVVRIAALDQ